MAGLIQGFYPIDIENTGLQEHKIQKTVPATGTLQATVYFCMDSHTAVIRSYIID